MFNRKKNAINKTHEAIIFAFELATIGCLVKLALTVALYLAS